MEGLDENLHKCLGSVILFAAHISGTRLRGYQGGAARAIVESVVYKRGDTIVVMFPRQSGKNELQAQVEAYLLTLYSLLEAEMVKVSPTWRPQSLNAMRRLERVLNRNLITRNRWEKNEGYIYKLTTARIYFLSGAPTSNVVGATATHLLECDEAQDVLISKWDKDFSPMAASRNATRVFWGTAWTSKTLLARELRAARQAEKRDGRRRVFVLTADEVREEVPEYGKFVDEQVRKLGRNHPLIKTQFFSEEIDAEGGMFPKSRQALMRGQHPWLDSPEPGKLYAALLDVAGEDEGAGADGDVSSLVNQQRDSTALTIVEVDLSTLGDELIGAPSYLVVSRHEWVGTKHTALYGKIKALALHWGIRYLVCDATGVGAGLTSFLDKALGSDVVIPFVFTSKSKSDLGWDFLAVVETGRFKDHAFGRHGDADLPEGRGDADLPEGRGDADAPEQREFWRQVEHCQATVLDGPGKMMRWGVPDGFRDPETGELLHDDLLISAALCSVLDELEWGLAESDIVDAVDPMEGMGDVF